MEVLGETTQWGKLRLETNGYVGIDMLQEQIRRKVIRRGFEFNIIVVGRSGLGKSTLVNTLFKANVSRRTCAANSAGKENGEMGNIINCKSSSIPPTSEVKSVSHVIEEKGMRVRLTITDTPGFGDHINNQNCWLPILEHINDQYEKYLSEEQNVNRKRHIPDTRIHCCLYFIAPTGHSLKPLDIECMRRLDKCVNIVPVIAKADTLTLEERTQFKARIREDLLNNGISLYPPKEFDDIGEAEEIVLNNKIRETVPFAVVGSDQQHAVNGRNVLGRRTQWGIIEVENRAHCEFADLRDMLIRTHMQDLVEVTEKINYENFRQERLQSVQFNGQTIDLQQLNESCL